MIDTFVYGASSHLVQSTSFAGAVALLTLAFRANRAQVRFWLWLWLSASLKFLIPFVLLSTAGGYVGTWAPRSSVEGIRAAAPTFLAADGSRFSGETQEWAGSSAGAPASDRTTFYKVLAVVWLCGFVCVALIRLRGWRRVVPGLKRPHFPRRRGRAHWRACGKHSTTDSKLLLA